jgi:hypothetical protein
MRIFACAVAALMLVALPLNSLERPTGGGGAGARPAPSNASRPAGGTPQGGGFNLNRDMSASKPPAPTRPAGGGATVATRPSNPSVNRPNNGANNGNVNRPNNGNVNRPSNGNGNNGNVNRPINGNGNKPIVGNGNNNNINVNRNVTNVNVNRNVVVNPVYHGGTAWGWNRGVVWVAAPAYYGGGFWGPFAIGVTTALVWGTIVNSQTHQTITSYQVQPSSPGATLLSNYQLTQTQCGPPNLVVIYGPNNSAICAYPNNLVSAGEYTVDSSNLSIVSL